MKSERFFLGCLDRPEKYLTFLKQYQASLSHQIQRVTISKYCSGLDGPAEVQHAHNDSDLYDQVLQLGDWVRRSRAGRGAKESGERGGGRRHRLSSRAEVR